jgi:hypothetical protein
MYLNLLCIASLSAYSSSSNAVPSEIVDWRLAGRNFLVKENPNPSRAANVSSCCILARRRAFTILSRAILPAVVNKKRNKNQISAAHDFHVSVTPFRQKFGYVNARWHDA